MALPALAGDWRRWHGPPSGPQARDLGHVAAVRERAYGAAAGSAVRREVGHAKGAAKAHETRNRPCREQGIAREIGAKDRRPLKREGRPFS